MISLTPTVTLTLDPLNPGQYFACCGLLELADRYWAGAQGWFERRCFCLAPMTADQPNHGLKDLLETTATATLEQIDPDDDFASPIGVGAPFRLRLDWWTTQRDLKVWAGSMRALRIARAMQAALGDERVVLQRLLDHGQVVYDPDEPDNKVEPFYFDARRGASAQAIDIGFSPDALQMTTTAYPAVEFLSLVGLQRFRPRTTDVRRVFDYFTWSAPLDARIAAAATCGELPFVGAHAYRFENIFRTDQRKHKAFAPAIPLGGAS